MKIPKVWIGTLYSGEAEFEQCCDAISKQTGIELVHTVYSNLPEKEAHNKLWDFWNYHRNEFDLFVKVDADTIIVPNVIEKTWKECFEKESSVTGVQLRLHDYFTDDLIAGLNFFSTKVSFSNSPDLFCDRTDQGHCKVLKREQVEFLEPAGLHCKNPHNVQSFHYGLHRMLKGQKEIIQKVKFAWQKYNDEARKFALLGAQYAIEYNQNIDYTNLKIVEIVREFENSKIEFIL